MIKLNNTFLYNISFFFFIAYFFIRPIQLYENLMGNVSAMSGMHAAISLGLFTFLLIYYIIKPSTLQIKIYDLAVYLLIIYMFLVIFLDYTIYGKSFAVYSINLQTTLYYLAFYLVGVNFTNIEKWYKLILLLFMILVVEKIIFYDPSLGHIILHLDEKFNSLYAFLGDSFAIFAIVLITTTKTNKYKIILFFTTLVILSILYTRTPLYVMFMLGFLFLSRTLNRKAFYILLIFIFTLVIFVVSDYSHDLASSRMFSFLMTGQDGSWHARAIQKMLGYNDIFNHPILGNYAGQYYEHGFRFGTYIHNIFSYYRQYGLIAVILMSFIFFYVAKYSYYWYKNYYSDKYDYIFYLVFFILLEVFFSRAYTLPYLFFAFGLIKNIQLKENNEA